MLSYSKNIGLEAKNYQSLVSDSGLEIRLLYRFRSALWSSKKSFSDNNNNHIVLYSLIYRKPQFKLNNYKYRLSTTIGAKKTSSRYKFHQTERKSQLMAKRKREK